MGNTALPPYPNLQEYRLAQARCRIPGAFPNAIGKGLGDCLGGQSRMDGAVLTAERRPQMALWEHRKDS
jgi:hypothetical protein